MLATLFYGFLFFAPYFFVKSRVDREFQDPQELNPNLFSQGLLQREDPNIELWSEEYKVPLLINLAFVLVSLIQVIRIVLAFKKAEKRRARQGDFEEEPKPNDQDSKPDDQESNIK